VLMEQLQMDLALRPENLTLADYVRISDLVDQHSEIP